MPGGDGTGPVGLGPMTGRAAGFCASYGVPRFANPVFGGGFGAGRGRGGGRGWRNRFFATGLPGWQRAAGWLAQTAVASFPMASTREQQIEVLKGQAKDFEAALEGIRRRIEELEAKTKGS